MTTVRVFTSVSGSQYLIFEEDVTNTYAPVLGAYDIKLVEFSFFPADERQGNVDPAAGRLICEHLGEVLDKEPNTVISYICDEHDGKQAARQRKFHSWCERYLPEHPFQPINLNIQTEQGEFARYAGLLTAPSFSYGEEPEHFLISRIPGIVVEKNEP